MNLNQHQISRLIEYLEEFVTEHKRTRIQEVLQQRTREVTVVLENIYHPQNASAALRSCECFGVQDVHIIESWNEFDPSPDVALGASKWLTIHRYRGETEHDQTARCLTHLRNEGYRIAATSLSSDAVPVSEVSVETPLALCFGNEEEGLSPTAQDYADLHVTVPMYGFTESFNISVSAALCMYDVCTRLRRERNDWGLSESEQRSVRLELLKKCIRNGDRIAENFLATLTD